MMRGSYTNINWSLDETVIEGTKVLAQFAKCGTHQGQFFGVPALGKQIKTIAMNFYQFADGKIEERGLPNLFRMMVQIVPSSLPSLSKTRAWGDE